tara:strand:- start:6981 stop:7793 length:813 start_codon:yes stop_codon:yes gene_type:complete
MIRFNNRFHKIISIPLYPPSVATPGESMSNYATQMLIRNNKICVRNVKDIFCTESYSDNLYKLYFQNKKHLSHGSLMNIGGDHNISTATVCATLHHNKQTKFIWINSNDKPLCENIPISYLSGLSRPPKNSIEYLKNTISPHNLFYIGLKDSNIQLQNQLETNSIKYLHNGSLNYNIYHSISEISAFIGINDPIYISIDLNIIDKLNKPHPLTDAIHINSLRILLNSLLSRHHILNMDISNLSLGRNNLENYQQFDNFQTLFEQYFTCIS